MLVTMGVAGFLSGPLARVIGSRLQVAIAGALMVVATVAIALAHATAWMLMAEAALFGLGLGVVYAAITSVVVQSVPPTQTGVASGMNTNLRTIGSSVGVTLMTAIVAGSIGRSGIPTEAGYTTGFLAVAAIGAGGVLAAVVAIVLARRFAAPVPTSTIATTAVSPFAEEEVVEVEEVERAA
jgi:MFS family permease